MLGLSGAVLQGYLRNPLAEPSVLGATVLTPELLATIYGISALMGQDNASPMIVPLTRVKREGSQT